MSFLRQMRSLEYFEYIGSSKRFFKYRGKLIRLPNVDEFKIGLFASVYDVRNSLPRIPFAFDELRVFYVNSYFQSMHCACSNFIKRHNTIQTLIVKYVYSPFESSDFLENGFLSKSQLRSSLPSLKEIRLDHDSIYFAIDDAVCYMIDLKVSTFFSFYCSGSVDDINAYCNSNDLKVLHLTPGPTHLSFIKLMRISNDHISNGV